MDACVSRSGRVGGRSSDKMATSNFPDLSSLKLPDFASRVQQLGDKEVGLAAVCELIQLLDLDVDVSENVGKVKPPFSGATWEAVAPQFGLTATRGIGQLNKFEVPSVILPPSFHMGVMSESLEWLDVYQARDAQSQEAARVRLMDAVRILASPWII